MHIEEVSVESMIYHRKTDQILYQVLTNKKAAVLSTQLEQTKHMKSKLDLLEVDSKLGYCKGEWVRENEVGDDIECWVLVFVKGILKTRITNYYHCVYDLYDQGADLEN